MNTYEVVTTQEVQAVDMHVYKIVASTKEEAKRRVLQGDGEMVEADLQEDSIVPITNKTVLQVHDEHTD